VGYYQSGFADIILNQFMRNTFLLVSLVVCLFVSGCANNTKQEEPKPTSADSAAKPDSDNSRLQHTHNYSANIYATVDISPMDMSYFPVEYYKLNMAKQAASPLIVRVIYSRPHLNGRKLFPDILKFNEPWRLGANESTEIQFFREVSIQGKKIKPGRYILYCIPNENTWTMVLNSNLDTWGLHQDTSKDLFRFDVPVIKVDHHTEYFTIIFEKTDKGTNLVAAWDDYEIKLPIDL